MTIREIVHVEIMKNKSSGAGQAHTEQLYRRVKDFITTILVPSFKFAIRSDNRDIASTHLSDVYVALIRCGIPGVSFKHIRNTYYNVMETVPKIDFDVMYKETEFVHYHVTLDHHNQETIFTIIDPNKITKEKKT